MKLQVLRIAAMTMMSAQETAKQAARPSAVAVRGPGTPFMLVFEAPV